MKAENLASKGCLQRDSVEREGYAGARSAEAREGREQGGAGGLLENILDRDNLNRAYKRVKRNRGRNVRAVMQEVKVFIRGWLGYYYVADMKRTLQSWNEWLRRRFRMYIWKQWKKPRTKVANLRKLGVPADRAYQWGNTRLGYWRIAGSPVLKCSITNEKLVRAGYFDFPAHYELIRKRHLCG